jgi:inner membrane transporter RhtA
MVTVQLGLVAAYDLFDLIGPSGTSALRLVWGGLILLVLVRPRRASFTRASFGATLALGLATAGMTLLFTESFARLPLGTATSLMFLGPLSVAFLRRRRVRRAALWPLLAASGVLLLTEPWRGEADVAGVLFALGAAICWGSYILLTQRVGDRVTGVQALAVSVSVAAVVATLVAGPNAIPKLRWEIALYGLGLAILFPLLAFVLEFLALRRLTTPAFGTIMALEPALASLLGFLFLGQLLAPLQLIGVALVVCAAVGTQRGAARLQPPTASEEPHPTPTVGS